MDKLKLKLTNCYGITSLDTELKFLNSNNNRRISIIYAPNGTMKSSLARTLKNYKMGNLQDKNIFGEEPFCQIWFDGNPILDSVPNIIVFDPLKEEKVNIDSVLVSDENIRREFDNINGNLKDKKVNLFNSVKTKINLKRTTDIEDCILKDFGFHNDRLLDCLCCIFSEIENPAFQLQILPNLPRYEELFSLNVVEFFEQPNQADLVAQYEAQYNELLEKSNYLGVSGFDHLNLDNIGKTLLDNKFFDANGKIVLLGKDSTRKEFNTKEEVDSFIQEEKNRILLSKELQKTFDKLTASFDKNAYMRSISNMFQSNKELVKEYTDIGLLKKKYWITAFSEYKELLEKLIDSMKTSVDKINEIVDRAKSEHLRWVDVIEEFKHRFNVPFEISISNQHNVIINGDSPSLHFSCKKGNKSVETNEDVLTRDVLSFGELRALKILNMLFKINALKEQKKQYLIVFDDIADSFDYNNKYAIIEYLADIADYVLSDGTPMFSVLLLSHNFDFFRTVAKRLSVSREQLYFASKDDENNISVTTAMYINDVFQYFQHNLEKSDSLNKRIIISSISFVRNLIGYKDGEESSDYNDLTNCLHLKQKTNQITISDIEAIFKRNWKSTINFSSNLKNRKYINFLYETADEIQNDDSIVIENKIVLSIAIRLKAEEHMISVVGTDFVDTITSNQTRKLFDKYYILVANKPNCEDKIKLMKEVLLMTSENIHINSFMFEPILDISLHHLYNLYQSVKKL